MANKKITPGGKYYKKVVYYEDEFHDRHVTVAILMTRGTAIYIGMSICCPQDKEKRELGRHIAKGRAEGAFDGTTGHSKATSVIRPSYHMDEILQNDDFFLKQIGRSFFFDFKSNPKKYIASYETRGNTREE